MGKENEKREGALEYSIVDLPSGFKEGVSTKSEVEVVRIKVIS